MSPDAATLGKYGTYNVNYYTGTPDISIGLHEVNENGMKVPIAISYDAGGFIPNKNAGIVGLNWSLTAGGAITRVVRGVPDDKRDGSNPPTAPAGQHTGFIKGQQLGLGTYTSEHIRTIGFINNITVPIYNLNYEYLADIFTFNFLGHSGKFFMDNSGQIQVVSDRSYKVDLTNFTPQNDFGISIPNINGSLTQLNTALYSQIVMTADDGYQFTFGGALKNLEISFPCPANTGVAERKGGSINAWYLTKVKTPDGNEILFNYKDYTTEDRTYIQNLFNNNNGAWLDIPAGFIEIKLFRNHTIWAHRRGPNTDAGNNRNEISVSLIKHAYLAEIKTNAQTIKFSYAEKDLTNKFYGSPSRDVEGVELHNIIRSLHTQRLTKIEVIDNFSTGDDAGVPSKRINFGYTNYGNSTGNRMFLTGIDINTNIMHYGFTYNNVTNLPDPLTRGIDVWGYYNGHDGNLDLIAIPLVNSPEFESDLGATNSYRLADPTYAKYGMLNTITYPTGGTSEFAFEGNTYSKVLKRSVTTGITPILQTVNGTTGGLRIKEIINTPGTTTTFKYITDYELNPNNPSSGLLSEYGIFYLYYHSGSQPSQTEEVHFITGNNIASAASYKESHIAYKEVVEINSEGFTKHKFTNHETNPDVYYLGNDSYKISPDASDNNFNQQLLRLYHYSSKEDERGKPLKTEVYNASNALKKSTEFTYNIDPLRESARTMGYASPFLFENWQLFITTLVQSYAVYYYQNNVTKVVEKDYGDNAVNPLVKTTTFKYRSNTSNLLDEKTVTKSTGEMFTNKYKYPVDFIAQEPYTTMVNDKKITAPVIVEEEYKGVSPSLQFIQSNETNYSFWQSNSIIKPSNVKATVGSGSPDTRLYFKDYDNKGHLISYSKDNTIQDSYIWDYDQTFPVAKVVNAVPGHFAYTSFEASGKGNWTFAGTPVFEFIAPPPTGNRIYQLNGSNNISKTGLTTSSVYIVSYWTKNTSSLTIAGTTTVTPGRSLNGWNYFEHRITGQASVTISGTGAIDELRLYPEKSLMTTYTYGGTTGITSQCDPNNRISYYEYDALGRLTLIRDQDRNILKRICYNFSGQPDNCGILTWGNVETSGTFIPNNCPSGQVGQPYPYTIPANTFTSIISPEDANLQATNYLNANGQNEANLHGTCVTAQPISITMSNEGVAPFAVTTVEFIQGGVVVLTKTIPATTFTLPAGTYDVRFTVPAAYQNSIYTYQFCHATTVFQWIEKPNGQVTVTATGVLINGIKFNIKANNLL
jgi:YD repeat-containing protein